jgi:hypothetical protein
MTAVDPRIPVRFGMTCDGAPGVALLIEGDAPAPQGVLYARFRLRPFAHFVGCVCCAPCGPAAEALARLYLAGVRGAASFGAVVAVTATPAGRREVEAALAADPLGAARFVVTP